MANNAWKQITQKAKDTWKATYEKELQNFISGASGTAQKRYGAFEQSAKANPNAALQYLTSNQMMKPKTLADYHADDVRLAGTDRAAYARQLREQGVFDTEDNAYGGYAHNVSTPYLQNLLDAARAKLSDSVQADKAYADNMAAWRGENEKAYRQRQLDETAFNNWVAMSKYEGKDFSDPDYDPTDEDMLRLSNLINGTDYKNIVDMQQRMGLDEDSYSDEWDKMVDLWYAQDWANPSLPAYTGMAEPEAYESMTGAWNDRISTLQGELNRRTTADALEAEAAAMPSYAELSVYQDNASDGTTGNAFVDFWNKPRTTNVGKYDDKNYFINNPIAEWQKAGAQEYSMAVRAYLNEGLDQLTSYERGVYNAFVNSGMQDKADEYLKSIEPLLLQRRAEAQDVKNELLATNPWTAVPAAVASVGGDILSGAMAPIQLAGEALGMVDGPYDAIYDINRASATTTGAQMQAIGEADPLKDVKLFGKTPLQNLFAGFKGAATNLGRAALGPGAALALAGGQAVSGSLYENAGREDMSGLAQATQALLTGLVEVGTEKIGLYAFFNKGLPGAKEYVRQLIVSEMGEEALAYLGGEAIDHAVSEVFGHKGQYATGEELWQGLGETLLTTALSSGLMSAPGAVQIRSANKAAGKGISSNDSIAQVLEIADSMDKSSASYAEAQNVKAAMEGGKKVSLNKLGRLANAMQKELGEEYGKVIGRVADDTIVERMVELGDSKDVAQKNVQAVKKAAQGQNLTAQERADLTKSSTAIQVVEELAGAAETSGEMAVKMQMRTMEAAAGIRSKQLGLQEAVRGKQAEKDVFSAEDDNASAKMVQAKPGTGAVTFLGEASSNQQVTGSGTEAALTNRMRSMTASQRNTVNGIKAIAKATGVNMVLFESTKEGRAAGVQNGSFVRGTNTIYLDINAGISTEAGMKGAKESGVLGYAMIRTLSHELTHFIEGNSKEGYAALMEQAKREFAAKGKDWDKLVVAKAKMSAAQGEKLTRTGAEAEVLADACEMMLQDTAAIERLAKQNPSLKEKIAGFIKSFVQKIQKALRAIGAGSAEAKALMDMRDGLMQYSEELTRLWGAGLEEAVGNAKSVEQQAAELSDADTQFSIRDDVDASADGTDIDTSTDSAYQQYSIRTWAESDYVAKREEAIDRLVNTLHVEREKAAKWIDDVNSISAIILDNKARLDYIPTAVEGVSAFKSNPEYGGSIDMSTICAKRRLATGTLDAIQNALGDAVLTKDDFLHIREMMKERGHEVACGLCFVESSRKNLSKYTKQFLDQFNATHPDNQVSMTDFNTVDGLERTRLLNQEAYAEYEKFMNKLAQRKPKLFEKRTEYRHEILQKFKKDTTVGAKNINGGLRLQSFSDFEIVHLIDMMQVITDMASVGLAGQAYTKVPDFAWALGDTGLKINLSLIAKGVDEDGNLIFDDVEGMNHEEAKRLRDAYSENVGTIVVAFTDEQIMAAMKSDFVDFIIPFHRSQWQKSDYKKLGLPEGTKDYTMHQNEKEGRKRVKENFAPNAYWDFSISGKQNAQKYLGMCASTGRVPKFAKFLQNNGDGTYSMKDDGSTDGYWKLLIDFKMYDNNGVGSPQNPVQPNFNMDEASRMLDTYNGIHDSFPVAQDVVDDFVAEYTGSMGGVKVGNGRVTIDNVQKSQRLPDDISTREYLADADSSIAANAEQANALEIYKTRIAAYREATRAVDQAKAALAATTDRDESIKVRNRLELLQKQQSRAYDQLIVAEDTKHIRELTGATTEFIQKQLAGKTEADIASMIAEAESEITSLTEQLSGLKGASREQTEAVKEQIRMLKARVTRLRNSATRKLLETRKHYQDMFQRDRARREVNAEANKLGNHIKAVVKRLNDRIVNESDYKNVKEGMKPAVQDLVRTFIDGFGSLVFDQRKADRLRAVYDKLAVADSDESAFYSDDVAAMIGELAELAGEDEARRKAPTGTLMDNAEKKLAIYSRVADIADNIWHMVQAADEIFVNGKRERFATLGNATGEAMLAKADYKQLYGLPGRLQKWHADLIRNGNMIPTYFFESLGNSGMQSLFDGIMSAQTGYSAAILAGQRAMQDAKRRYHYAAWQDQNPVEITTSQGHKVRLTVEQMMSLYATAKREASNELMQTHHLEIGGFKLEGEQRAAEKGKGKWIVASSQAHRLTEADVTKITNTLTAEQRAYADEMVKYLSEDMAELGNKASMEMFGIRKYQEKYYFPFKTASENRYQKSNAGNLSTTDDARLKHSSFTHRLTKGANTTLVIGDFSNVIADHINHMATYANFVSPIESMNRVLNYKVEEEDGNVTAIRALLGRKYGESSQNYVQTLLKDLNGGVQTDSRGAGAVNALISAFKRGAVASSLSVAVQQPTAYLKAFGYISPKYFAHLTGEGHKAAWEEAMRYSGTAVIKDMGKFDLGLGQTANEWISKADESELALWERFKAYWPWTKDSNWTTAKTKWNGLLYALPGWMDQVTWTHIWKAVKAEQADLHPGVDTSSEAFLRLCGMRFDEVINHTQVYDSVLSRSNLMRSSNSLHKMATAFMAEPTLTANIMRSAVRGNHTMAERTRMIGSALGSSLLAAAFAAAISAWNDDEDDRPAAEKYLDKFSALAFDNLNPAGWIPYISDVSSMLEGYDVERADMSVISDMVQYSEKFFAAIKDGRMPTWKESENYIGTMLNLLGVPAKNISRDIRRIRNAATTTWEGTTAANIGFTVLENLPYGAYDGSNTAYYERYAAALIGGDKQKAYNIKDYLLSSKGVKEDNFKNKVKSALGEAYNAGKMDEDTAKQLLVANGLAKDAKEAFQVVDKWEEGGASYSAYNTVREAFAVDDEKAVQEAISELKSNGYTGEEISSYLKNQKVIREAVEKGQISPERATYYLRKYAPYKNDKDNINKPKEWAGKQ